MTTWSPKAERALIANVSATPRLRRRSIFKPLLGFLLMVAAPTALAAYYYYAIAVDRYVSEFRYSVRGGAQMVSSGDTGGISSGSAALVFAADSFVLEDYLVSVQAFEDIEKRLPLREMLAKDGDDPIRRYDGARPAEEMLPYWENAVAARFDAVTGITTVKVTMFSREDARAVSDALIEELQIIVDGMTSDARQQMLAFVEGEFQNAEAELNKARERVREFREKNKTFSPGEQVEIDQRIISELQSSLSQLRLELKSLILRAPGSPRLPGLAEEIEAVEAQLFAEYESRGSGNRAMASQLAEFEELQQDYELALQNYVNANNIKQQAEANAMMNQALLVVFVKPRLPNQSIAPDRPFEILIIFAFAALIWTGFRVFFASFPTQ